jgi:hypothetical protein
MHFAAVHESASGTERRFAALHKFGLLGLEVSPLCSPDEVIE